MRQRRTIDQVSREIEVQRHQLATSLTAARRDARRLVKEKRAFVRRQVPIAAGLGLALTAALIARRVLRPETPRVARVRLRFGRFAVVEY